MIVQLPLGISPLYPYWAAQARIALNPAAPLIGKAPFQATLAIQRFLPLDGPYGARLNAGHILTGVTG
tara:strand:+ start:2032 stop:2235 length:204 start_codon:yes stop_codon:yes gene_type:complete